MDSELPEWALVERRKLINAASAAGAAYRAASLDFADDSGLTGNPVAVATEREAWEIAERQLAWFYAQFPMKVHRKAFNDESRAYRGRAAG